MNCLNMLCESVPGYGRELRIAAQSEMTVLVLGPTGAGKSSLARKIHAFGPRAAKPFVSVNLATLHDGTFESELFGHERGAFTGAEGRRVGRLELAQGGTVFLDEVGELPISLQGRLLEVLQSKVITPVGGNREIPLNVRFIAATNRDLQAEVSAGRFREDLFHRLRVLSISMPALIRYPERFDGTVHRMIEELCRTHKKSVYRLSEEVALRLERHTWPGNYRELRNVLEYCVLSCEGSEVGTDDLPGWFAMSIDGAIRNPGSAETRAPAIPMASTSDVELTEPTAASHHPQDYTSAMYDFERELLTRSLKRFHGKVSLTARRMAMSKTTLLRRMRHLGVRVTPEGDVIWVPGKNLKIQEASDRFVTIQNQRLDTLRN